MRKIITLLIILIFQLPHLKAQQSSIHSYIKKTYMVPMRDSTHLFTVVLLPTEATQPLPFLIQRTPYGADINLRNDSLYVDSVPESSFFKAYLREGYILVIQDMRGKFNSEGSFEMTRPLYHLTDSNKTDESTDAWDLVEWLVNNIPDNNGKAGIFGISYLGYTALNAISDPHPALKASSPQASPTDMFLGDDFHHNGAFRLSYGLEYSYMVENEKESNSSFPFPQYDLYGWYLSLGPLKNINDRYYHNRIAAWNNFVQHPNYDSYWQNTSLLTQIQYPQIPVLHVGGYYDQEDLNGPQIMYEHLEKKDNSHNNYIVLGPWNHGGWAESKGDSLGQIAFENNTAQYFQNLQKQWFDYWLKGIGEGRFDEANCFQTGTNQWKTYTSWPPEEAADKRLYLHADGSCSFEKPTDNSSTISYVSDPGKPVPYRMLPIEATYGSGSRWSSWQVEDQRFVSTRPDVVSFIADSLESNLTVTGNVKAHLFVSTSGTDADFVVKLIDVYPDFDDKDLSMSGYQFPVTMEVFRGRFRKSFTEPEPFVPGQPQEVVIDLHQINHTFLKGHKMMIQIQSTWFPVIDRNPQKYVPNIFEARESDFVKATETIYCNEELATYIELPLMEE
jgi:putative CocE/NonD family hydrolase